MPIFGNSTNPESPAYASKTPLEKRKEESRNIREKYPDRIPCIVERAHSAKNTPMLDKKKYIVPDAFTVGNFIYVIRKRIKLAPEQAIYFYVNNVLPLSTQTLGQVYEEHKGEDGFLAWVYACENSFGEISEVSSVPDEIFSILSSST